MATQTHYIPSFTRRRPDGTQETVCGQFLSATQHSVQPTCWGCAMWLDNSDHHSANEPARVLAQITPQAPWGIPVS